MNGGHYSIPTSPVTDVTQGRQIELKLSTGTIQNNKRGQKGNEQINILFEVENCRVSIIQVPDGCRPWWLRSPSSPLSSPTHLTSRRSPSHSGPQTDPEIQLILFLGPVPKIFLINFTPFSLNLPCPRNAPFGMRSLVSMLLARLQGPSVDIQ